LGSFEGDEMKIFAVVLLVYAITGCATIFEGPSKAVTIDADVPAAKFKVVNREGRTIHTGTTPQRLTLNNGYGYFTKEKYTVNMAKPGYEDTTAVLEPGIAGWYFGNIVAGGLIGMLIVDPITGAMYKLPDDFVVPMRKAEGGAEVAEAGSAVLRATPRDVGAKIKAYGTWQYQAEKLAAASQCDAPSFISQGAGIELYSTICSGTPNTIRCEFGKCAVN
jgi:hypothetical protein